LIIILLIFTFIEVRNTYEINKKKEEFYEQVSHSFNLVKELKFDEAFKEYKKAAAMEEYFKINNIKIPHDIRKKFYEGFALSFIKSESLDLTDIQKMYYKRELIKELNELAKKEPDNSLLLILISEVGEK
jgi:hypothetical protein